MMMTGLTALLAVLLAAIHLVSGRVRSVIHFRRPTWKSVSGGIAVSYVFLQILPELAAHQETITAEVGLKPDLAESFVFMMALTGMTVFYGMERLLTSKRFSEELATGAPVFWVRVGAFSLYNMLVGYLLVHREEPGLAELLLYFFAMATHFLAFDLNLSGGHQRQYHRIARWILAAALLAGWATAVFTDLTQLPVSVLFAFLAGGIVLNVLKEELPGEKQGRFLPFLAGVVGYSLLLVVL